MSEKVRCHNCRWIRTAGPCDQYYHYCGLDEDVNWWERVDRWHRRADNAGMRDKLDGTCDRAEPMIPGLKPCPFCGGEAHLATDYSSEQDETMWNVWHECNGFEGESSGYGYSLHPWFETPWYKSKHRAVEAWNRRSHGRDYIDDTPVSNGNR